MTFRILISFFLIGFLQACHEGGVSLPTPGEGSAWQYPTGSPGSTTPQNAPSSETVSVGDVDLRYQGGFYLQTGQCNSFEIALVDDQQNDVVVTEDVDFSIQASHQATLYQDAQCVFATTSLTIQENQSQIVAYIKKTQDGLSTLTINDQVTAQIEFMNLTHQFDINNRVYSIFQHANSPDSLFIAGDFTVINGKSRSKVAKIYTTGLIEDSPFNNSEHVLSHSVYHIAADASGVAEFASANKVYRAKFYPNVDPVGDESAIKELLTTVGSPVYKMVYGPGGTFLLGNFVGVIGSTGSVVNTQRISRLPAASQIFETGFENAVRNALYDSSGKLVLVGSFSTYKGVSRNGIARIHTDGTLDTSFNPGSGFDSGLIKALAFSPSGKIYAGGNFSQFQGLQRNGVVRMHANGSVDSSFSTGSGFTTGSTVHALMATSNGKIYVAGDFNTYKGQPAPKLIRLNANGTRDTSFVVGGGFNGTVFALEEVKDGSGDLWVGGEFTTYNGQTVKRLARITSNGLLK